MEIAPGLQIKGYELQERIAVGGFGAVYRAYQSTVRREVAIKVILPSLANKPQFIRRFEAEAQLIARLEHMNIVPLYDYWRDPDGAYLVMRYLRGGSLHDRIRKQGALSIEDALNLFAQVSQALHVAHRNRVVHRDIKPGNILLDEDGNGYLSDFGIAKDRTPAQSTTEPDSVIGSTEYLAPEQVRSEPATPQTDIYSLGVVLYEMLTGTHPFPNLETISYIFKHLNDPLPEIRTLDDSICAGINAVIQRATSKDPKQRFTDVIEMMQALQHAAHLDTAATSTSLVELLTPREQEVMQLMIDGKTNREIADILVLAEGTVKQYSTSIYRKLKVRSRVQAIARARDLNFVVKKPEVAVVINAGQLPVPKNPYKGLRAFQVADVQDFYGREKLIQRLLSRLQEDVEYRRFLAVVGPSGSGKSSVVKAGLIPALWRGDLPGSENWYIVDLLPGRRPLDELEIALLRVISDTNPNLRDQLERDKHGLHRVANLILPNDGSELLIVIDQFEEVFTLLEDEDDRQYFLDLLHEAVTDERSRVRIVVTLRADYYDRPLHYSPFGELIRSRVETVLPLSAEELERAVCEPARGVGVQFEDSLVSRIVGDVHYQPGALPLLQYALTELFERRDGLRLTQAVYTEIGGTGGALAKRADEIYLEGSEQGQELARQLFLRLVTLGEGAEDTRRRVARSELLEITADQDQMDELIDLYATSRLLTLDNDPSTHQPTVEVAHEAILREWERLQRWLNESREDIRQERLTAQAAEAWKANDRDKSYLLTGTRLEQAKVWREITELALAPLEHEFIQTSIHEAKTQALAEAERQAHDTALERRTRTMLQALVAVFAVAAILSGGFGLFALSQRNEALEAWNTAKSAEREAQRQASIGLAGQASLELVEGVPYRAVLLALEALQDYPYTWQAERALFAAVQKNQVIHMLDEHSDWVNTVDWSSAGAKLLTSSDDGSARIWDTETGGMLRVLSGHSDWVLDARWSPDERQIATASKDGTAVIWDADTGDMLMALPHGDRVNTIAWSPNQTYLLTAGENNPAKVWDAQTGELVTSLTYDVVRADWSPDGRYLATADLDGNTRIWDTATFKNLHVMAGTSNPIQAPPIWSPDGTRIATIDNDDNFVAIWAVSTGEQLYRLPSEQRGIIFTTAWSPDGSRLLSVENGNNQVDGIATIWDMTTGERIYRLPGLNDMSIGVWSPSGDRVAVADENDVVRVWNAQSGEMEFALRNPGVPSDVEWSPGGERLAVAYSDGLIILWDTTDLARLTIPGQNSGIATWSPDGKHFLRKDWDGPLVVMDSNSGEPVMNLPAANAVWATWSPDSQYIGTANSDGTAHIWDADFGEEQLAVDVDVASDFIAGPFWSPDSKHFTYVDFLKGVAYAFDLNTGERINTFGKPNSPPMCLAVWSPDGTRIAAGIADGSIKIWDFMSGEELLSINLAGPICGIDWSPDGTRLAAANTESGLAYVLNSETGELVLTFGGHVGAVNTLEWSPDGTRIVSAGDDATRIWDSVTGAEYGVLDITDWQAHWSPDGEHIMTIGPAGTLRIWDAWQDTESLVDYASACCVFRQLTLEERQLFGLPLQ